MPIIKLTQQLITHELHCPEGKSRVEFCDKDLPGLYVEVRASNRGQGTYYLRYKDATSKTCHQKIGRTCDIDLADARKRAKLLKAEISVGADPRGDTRKRESVVTVKEYLFDYYLPYIKPRKRSWKSDVCLIRRVNMVFGNKRLNQVTRQQIQKFHTDLREAKLAPATCDHHIKLLKHAMNLAIDWGMLDKNPVARVPLFNVDNKRENYLDESQLERLLKVLRTDSNRPVCLIALFLLSTGARLNEALSATWSNLDAAHRVWRIAAINSKSKRMRSVPLNDSALDVLAMLDSDRKHDHVFINRETGKPYTTIAKVWTRLRNKAGLPHLRLHDLRHSYASFLVNSGRSIYEVSKALGHADVKVTERYAHLSSKTLQDAANSASVIIKGAMPVAS